MTDFTDQRPRPVRANLLRRRGGADSKPECDNGGQEQSAVFADGPKAEARVLPEGRHI